MFMTLRHVLLPFPTASNVGSVTRPLCVTRPIDLSPTSDVFF